MARYRKIDVRIHGDEKFRRLSAPPPCGRYLWFFLLTTKRSTSIPGLFEAGEAALAEELEWSLEGFRKAFQELVDEGIAKADWKARVVWLPNAIKHNPPENPNVVKGWASHWDELPECGLKNEAYDGLFGKLQALGRGLAEPFAKGCRKGMANQEQEQEQEQEQDLVGAESSSTPPPIPGNSKPEPPTRAPGTPPKPRRDVTTTLRPSEWSPSPDGVSYARELGIDQSGIDATIVELRNWKGTRAYTVDWWDTKWVTFVENRAQWAKEPREPRKSRASTGDESEMAKAREAMAFLRGDEPVRAKVV